MRTHLFFLTFGIMMATAWNLVSAQQTSSQPKPEDTEVWQPEPRVVTSGSSCGAPPSDAIILFDGKNLDEWVSAQDRSAPAKWIVGNGIVTVEKTASNLRKHALCEASGAEILRLHGGISVSAFPF